METMDRFTVRLLDGSADIGLFSRREDAEDTLKLMFKGRGTVEQVSFAPYTQTMLDDMDDMAGVVESGVDRGDKDVNDA